MECLSPVTFNESYFPILKYLFWSMSYFRCMYETNALWNTDNYKWDVVHGLSVMLAIVGLKGKSLIFQLKSRSDHAYWSCGVRMYIAYRELNTVDLLSIHPRCDKGGRASISKLFSYEFENDGTSEDGVSLEKDNLGKIQKILFGKTDVIPDMLLFEFLCEALVPKGSVVVESNIHLGDPLENETYLSYYTKENVDGMNGPIVDWG